MIKNILASLALLAAVASAQQQGSVAAPDPAPCQVATINVNLSDWSQLSRYRLENATLAPPLPTEKRVVFFGSSTTDNWGRAFDSVFFPGKPYINRGISGQTTAQMLVRFQQDVVALKPAAVVFLGGTNDVAGNTGPATLSSVENNIRSMLQLAQANGIRMILASQLPVKEFPWNKSCRHPDTTLLELSAWERRLAAEQHLGYIDYYSVLVAPDGNFRPGLSPDGVHPNKKAYELMTPVAEEVIERTLTQP